MSICSVKPSIGTVVPGVNVGVEIVAVEAEIW
jgi:hypothetical protein